MHGSWFANSPSLGLLFEQVRDGQVGHARSCFQWSQSQLQNLTCYDFIACRQWNVLHLNVVKFKRLYYLFINVVLMFTGMKSSVLYVVNGSWIFHILLKHWALALLPEYLSLTVFSHDLMASQFHQGGDIRFQLLSLVKCVCTSPH